MEDFTWAREFPGAITVCDTKGIIVYMNDRSAKTFEKDGGAALVGQSLLDCHSAHSQDLIQQMLETQERNVYTIEKNGVRKIIYQSPWYQNGQFAGLVEISLEIPAQMPHFVRG